MKLEVVETTLKRLAELIGSGQFEELETDTLEIKPVPTNDGEWREIHKSACAFLNTRGGIIILGIREEGTGMGRHYIFSGWRPHAEPNVKEIAKQFTDEKGRTLSLSDSFPPPALHEFNGGQVAIVLVDELAADRKFVFYRGEAYRRMLTGDHKIGDVDRQRQREFQEEALQARELQLVPRMTVRDLDLDKLNEYITQLNRPQRIETIKPDLDAAIPFLQRKFFIIKNQVTTLGALVCGQFPQDYLGFRCQLHGYVDVPQEVARDKRDFTDNILPLMENGLAYVLRNIQVGVSVKQGGSNRSQYPEALLREMINNALAHRDYSINRQVILIIKPGEHISIRNPGTFRKPLLIEDVNVTPPLCRVLPEAKPRNPKLADVLRVFRKWEGRGIGMATLVNLCLQNEIDLPYYRFGTEEVTLYLCTGRLLDDRVERHFQSFDGYIEQKLSGTPLTQSQKFVLAYLIKSEWANEQLRYTILLTPDNNHFNELLVLERAGLIFKHAASTSNYPIYISDRNLVQKDYFHELSEKYGENYAALDGMSKEVLSVVYRYNTFSKTPGVSAKMTAFNLWNSQGQSGDDIKAFDTFARRIRRIFNNLEKTGFVKKDPSTKRIAYVLDNNRVQGLLKIST
ncbi:MAG: hypothetical protein HC853_09455 [Anaerolineae bacterium]|nr:hypothetical protein [Anaerolineae bacterium]